METTTPIFNKRAFLLKIYSVTLVVISLYAILGIVFRVPLYKVGILATLGILLLIGFLLARKKQDVKRFAQFYLVCLYSVLCFFIACNGGIHAPGVFWFVMLPLVSFLTLSSNAARLWLIIILLTVGAFYFFGDLLVLDVYTGGARWYVITPLLLFLTVFVIISTFHAEVTRKSQELKVLNEHLEASKAALLKQHDLVKEAEAIVSERNTKLEDYLNQISELNESLEKKVEDRTAALKIVNEKLRGFAFMNGHSIRGPICRLLGIRNLLVMTDDPKEIKTLGNYLSQSIEELDEITRTASNLLADTEKDSRL